VVGWPCLLADHEIIFLPSPLFFFLAAFERPWGLWFSACTNAVVLERAYGGVGGRIIALTERREIGKWRLRASEHVRRIDGGVGGVRALGSLAFMWGMDRMDGFLGCECNGVCR